MSSIPSNFSRVPMLLNSQQSLLGITRTQVSLFDVQQQLSSGIAVGRFSDDAVKAAAISVLDGRLALGAQRHRNLDHADSALGTLDTALGDAGDLVNQAKSIASTEVGAGATASEREAQAHVVDSLISSLYSIANRSGVAGHIFGGSTPSSAAVTAMLGGYRYTGQGPGLLTDLGLGSDIPITLGAGNAIGDTSARALGDVDLDPALTAGTRLSDIGGARGAGVTPGQVQYSFAGGPNTMIDLSGADSIQDVATRIQNSLRDYEQAHGVTILGPGGVSVSGGSLSIDVAPASNGPNPQLTFSDITAGVTAQDLGLAGPASGPPLAFSTGSASGLELNAKLSMQSPISALRGITGPLGSIKINNLGQSRILDLSSAHTLEDVKNMIEGTGLGLRVELNADRTGINIANEVAAGRQQAMSIEEVSGNNLTATRLGIRTLSAGTRIQDFNDGRGVQIANGNVDPVTGLPDPARDVDFSIALGNAPAPNGTTFNVDLRPQDMTTVQTVIDRINAQAQAAGVNVPGDFQAGLSDTTNGLVLRQNASFGGAITLTEKNNSPALEGLGLSGGAYDQATRSFRATDPAKVRVDNLFTQLIDLRDALTQNNTSGITLASERLDTSVDRLSETRALVGSYAKRVTDGTKQLEDQTLLDQRTKSGLQDTDYTAAAVRLNQLQVQLQAGLQVTAQSLQRSLLDFLG